jgi:hypothetical protein
VGYLCVILSYCDSLIKQLKPKAASFAIFLFAFMREWETFAKPDSGCTSDKYIACKSFARHLYFKEEARREFCALVPDLETVEEHQSAGFGASPLFAARNPTNARVSPRPWSSREHKLTRAPTLPESSMHAAIPEREQEVEIWGTINFTAEVVVVVVVLMVVLLVVGGKFFRW